MNENFVKRQDVIKAIMVALNKVVTKKSATISDVAKALDAELMKVSTYSLLQLAEDHEAGIEDDPEGYKIIAGKLPKTVDELLLHLKNDY
jgi:hypothetical protein